MLGLIKAKQKVREADDCAGGLVTFASDRLRKGVVRPVCKRVTINGE
jgi:hypothetical protein